MQDNPAKAIKPYSQYFSGKASVYRNALPDFNNGVLDFTSLAPNDSEVAYACLQDMLQSRAFSRTIQVDYGTDEALHHLYFEARNARRNKGHHVLGLGFPLLISKQSDELLSVPLFIWPLSLEVAKAQGEWGLSYPPERPVSLNPYFPHFIMMKYGLDIEPDLEQYLGTTINAAKLAGFCDGLATKLDLKMKSQQVSLMSCPGTGEIDDFTEQDTLQWAGVIGNFPYVPPQNKSDDLNELLALNPIELSFQDFGTESLDPWQASATQHTRQNFITLVEGASGTGKRELVHHYLSNALANGGKCLVVSENLPALQSLQKTLSSQQMDNLLFLLSDEVSDKVLLKEVIKARSKAKNPSAEEMPQSLRVLLDRMQRRKETLEAKYQAANKPAFGKKDFAQTLGLYLESSQIEPKELLNSYLDENDFSFTEEELENIVEAISKAPVLFNEIGTLDHPLSILNANIFLHFEEKPALEFIKEKLETFGRKATKIQHRFIKEQNDYAETLKEHYSNYFHRLRNKAFDLRDKISDYTSHFGEDLRKSGKGTLKLYGIFSDKFKQALNQREVIFETYTTLQDIFYEHQYFEHQFEKTEKNIDLISSNLNDFTQHLQHWWQLQKESTKDELLRLTHKTAHPQTTFADRLKSLEEDMETFVEEINESGLYQLPWQCNMLTVPRKQRFLEDKMSVMEQTSYHLRDFASFYPWQRFWFSQNTLTRKVIKSLGRVNPLNWEAAFRSWYFHKALSLAYDPDLPTEDFGLEDYHDGLNSVISQLPGEIRRIWAKRRNQKSDDLKKVAEDLMNGQQNLSRIFSLYSEEITDFLPILLATPKMASLCASETPIFDYLLIDEAQNIYAESGISLFPLAKRVIVFTNPDTEIAADVPLPYVLRHSGTPARKLEHQHENRAANILDNNNQVAISANYINGRFEDDSNTNNDEADKVIHLLNSIQKTSTRTYPSVGIVCLTVKQRDLITGYLLRIKQQRQTGVETIQQLERNGLGVFHYDELDGRLFDQVILSATFGETGVNAKKLTKRINTLNTAQGVAGMHKIIGCVKNELKVIHSLPKKYLDAFLQQEDQRGTFLLAGLISGGLPILQKQVPEDPETRKVWLDQLERLLRQQNNEASFSQQDGHLIMQLPDEQYPKLLLTNGFFAQTPNTDFGWEFEQRTWWKREKGIEVVPVWPVEWR